MKTLARCWGVLAVALLAAATVSAKNYLICNRRFNAAFPPPTANEIIFNGPIGIGQSFLSRSPLAVNAPQNDGITNHDHLEAGIVYSKCVITNISADSTLTTFCNTDFIMANSTGTISTQSVGHSANNVTYYASIVGGTGAYSGASGEVKIVVNFRFNAITTAFTFNKKPKCT